MAIAISLQKYLDGRGVPYEAVTHEPLYAPRQPPVRQGFRKTTSLKACS
jgi:hypothetical protein